MKADKDTKKVTGRNCWDCTYNDLTGTSFFGRCTWFEQQNKRKSKVIPKEMVDKGCKFFEPRK